MSNKQRILVVGNGMVGHRFIDTMLASPKAAEFSIATFTEESRLAYDRVQLSSYFTGASADDLALTDAGQYNEQGIEFLLNEEITEIDRANKQIRTASGRTRPYDTLVLATGSYPFVPPVPGREQPHCLVYRTIDDLESIEASAGQSRVGVVIGGGLLGLEAANALKSAGLQTHVVEFAPRLMAVQLDDAGGALLKDKIQDIGVSVHTDKNTSEIVAGDNCRYRMNFADGSFLETDMIVFSAGIRPRDELARNAGLAVGERGGIVIDDHCRTSDPDIYAIGECALWQQRIYGLVAPGYAMARAAASHLTGGSEVFAGADMSTKLKLLGVDVASIGDAHGATTGAQSYVYQDQVAQIYKRLVVSADNKQLLGAVLVGDVDAYNQLLQLKLNDLPLPDNPAQLILPATDSQDPALGVDALPESAQICSCFDVSKGQLQAAIREGCTDMPSLKASTKAGSGCGGCVALTRQVLDSELASLGHEVRSDICEHFAYSRQELADIIRVNEIKSFDDLLDSHGKGLGCETCKPAVASILASYWNHYVLDDQHLELQDTNDIFLGNMQKDGSYSVVPRIPAGEITPAQLIAIGEVGRKFDLYTKITGGQRIDLFGAQLHQLPDIWQQLIDAGFETGHAYGKSLRTVKSCVGDTWCRYGVDDSMTLAIDLENRYKGLRAPHKLKFGVSGCTRECAEARGKDIGVIATEQGWNLYICGNGGMRPRHADLFAGDLDRATLIRYIDRILMFYIRTADRLQRTSVWLENLEGGIEYLREVVINDSLNLAADLEAAMANSLARYQCEWQTTLDTPSRLKRFRHFINSCKADNNLEYVAERRQRRPARPQTLSVVALGD